jgi:hypothetical protein
LACGPADGAVGESARWFLYRYRRAALYSVVAALGDFAAGAGWRRGAQLFVLTVATVAVTLFNPYGVGMWETVAHALRNL